MSVRVVLEDMELGVMGFVIDWEGRVLDSSFRPEVDLRFGAILRLVKR